jgi:hypothetical protein
MLTSAAPLLLLLLPPVICMCVGERLSTLTDLPSLALLTSAVPLLLLLLMEMCMYLRRAPEHADGAACAALALLTSAAPLLPLLLLLLVVVCLCSGERLSTLTGLPALRSLSLMDGSFGEDCLAHVGRCTKLTRLELQVRGSCNRLHTLCCCACMILVNAQHEWGAAQS